jgi:hypothetical protein
MNALESIRRKLESARRTAAVVNRADMHHALTLALRAIEHMAEDPGPPMLPPLFEYSELYGRSPLSDAQVTYTNMVTPGSAPTVQTLLDAMREFQAKVRPLPPAPPGYEWAGLDGGLRPLPEWVPPAGFTEPGVVFRYQPPPSELDWFRNFQLRYEQRVYERFLAPAPEAQPPLALPAPEPDPLG